MNRRLPSPSPWPWLRSLATAVEGETLRVENILFGTIARKCEESGIRAGETVTCREVDESFILLELENGDPVELAIATAWFVEARHLSGPNPRSRPRKIRTPAEAGPEKPRVPRSTGDRAG